MHRESTVKRSACPLDCPDACTLDVTVENGRVVEIAGNRINPITEGYICRKVRHFPEHMYGPDRVLHPSIRTGAKGEGKFRRATWDEALDLVADKLAAVKRDFGGEAILPYCYGGSNGYLTQDAMDARFFRRLGASRLARTLCAAATGRAARGLYGGIPGVAYPDFVHAKLIVLWGVNPSASGIHLAPYVKEARKHGAKMVVVDPVRTPLAASAEMHLAVRPGTDVIVALAVADWLFANNRADLEFLAHHANGVDEFRRRAARWPISKAAEAAGLDPDVLTEFAQWYADSAPALIRCGWGPERNRNGGSGIAAVLALPAVAGKFGVRGGGYTMSNTPAWDLKADAAAQTAPIDTRLLNMNELGKLLTEPLDPPIKAMFVYNANPVASSPNQRKILEGLAREDLFVVVHEQVTTDTAVWADVLLPATTFLEHDELSKGYGAMILNRAEPVADPVGESRSNIQLFGDLCRRMNLAKPGDLYEPAELSRAILQSSSSAAALLADVGDGTASTVPPCGPHPIQFANVFPRTATGKIELVSADLDAEAPGGLYAYRAPAASAFPLTLVSPATAKTVSSTLAQLWKEPAEVWLHPHDAEPRGLAHGSRVRVFNGLGEVACKLRVTADVRPGVALMHKGFWRRHTDNGYTATALAPDSLTDLGGGACFNDAQVDVAGAA